MKPAACALAILAAAWFGQAAAALVFAARHAPVAWEAR